MESLLHTILKKMKKKGYDLPEVAIAGGIVMEDQVFKVLALGEPYINMVGIGRGAMTAATVGKQVEELLKEGKVPKEFQKFGNTKEDLFQDIRELKLYYENPEDISGGAIGLFSYLNRVKVGLQQFMALNRKFDLKHISRSDVVPLTKEARKVTGLKDYKELTEDALEKL
jgi:tRNA-dihydrouridine synthase